MTDRKTFVSEVPISEEIRFVGAFPLTCRISLFVFNDGRHVKTVLHGAITNEQEKHLLLSAQNEDNDVRRLWNFMYSWLERRQRMQ